MPLLIRPRPFKDESFRGHILRASEANLYSDSKALFRFAGLQKYNKFDNLLIPDKDLDLTKVSELFLNDNLSDMVLINQLGASEINENNGIKHHFWRYGTCVQKQRFCPICLKTASYHKNIWEISLFVVCPIHNCLMVDQCGGCGSKINPYRQRLLFCKCGFDYRQSEIIYRKSIFADYLYKRFYQKDELPLNLSMINELSLCSFLYLMIITSRWVNGTLNTRSVTNFSQPLSNSNIDYILDRCLNIFREWPTNFYEFIDELRLEHKGERQTFVSYSKIQTLINDNLNYDQYQFIQEKFNYYLLNFLKTGYSGKIACDEISFKRILSKLHATTIRKNRKTSKEGTSRKEIAEIFGVGLDQIEHFVNKGILTPIKGPSIDGNPYILFNKNEALNLLEKIGDLVLPSVSDDIELLTFYEAVSRTKFYDMSLADFFLEIIKKNIKPYKVIEGKGLNRFLFDPFKLDDFLLGGYLTIKGISEMLKIKRGSVERLVKQGYIKVSKTYRLGKFQLVSPENFAEFRRNYIPAVEIVRTHKTINSTEKLLKELLKLGIEPINQKELKGDIYLLKVTDPLIIYMKNMCSAQINKEKHPPLKNYYYIT